MVDILPEEQIREILNEVDKLAEVRTREAMDYIDRGQFAQAKNLLYDLGLLIGFGKAFKVVLGEAEPELRLNTGSIDFGIKGGHEISP